jgi:hypothetical protein
LAYGIVSYQALAYVQLGEVVLADSQILDWALEFSRIPLKDQLPDRLFITCRTWLIDALDVLGVSRLARSVRWDVGKVPRRELWPAIEHEADLFSIRRRVRDPHFQARAVATHTLAST